MDDIKKGMKDSLIPPLSHTLLESVEAVTADSLIAASKSSSSSISKKVYGVTKLTKMAQMRKSYSDKVEVLSITDS